MVERFVLSMSEQSCPVCKRTNPETNLSCEYCGEILDFTISQNIEFRERLATQLKIQRRADGQNIDDTLTVTDNSNEQASSIITENFSVTDAEVDEQPFGQLNLTDYVQLTEITCGYEYRIELCEDTQEIVLGRPNRETGHVPLVDLTLVHGHKKGVSRCHAVITPIGKYLQLVDQSSHNGTYLNGVRLVPKQTRVIRDGDIIQLGGVKLRVNY